MNTASPTVLVIDDMAIFREPISVALKMAGYRTVGAESALQALELIDQTAPDLILLDVAMPIMGGLAFLRSLRNSSRWRGLPVVLLTALAEKSCVMEAAELGVSDYLVKSYFSLDQLLSVVKRNLDGTALSAEESSTPAVVPQSSSMAETLSQQPTAPRFPRAVHAHSSFEQEKSHVLHSRLKNLHELKTLAGSVCSILSMTNSTHTKADELVDILSRDPVLSARVLQMANSAAYACTKNPANTLQQAVVTLGFQAIRQTALQVGVFDALPASALDGFDAVRCWEHCSAVGHFMDWMIPDNEVETKGVNHLIGLCHDIPELVLRAELGQEFEEMAHFSGETTLSFGDITELLLGVRYHELVGYVLSRMGLPKSIVKPICDYSRRLDSPQAEDTDMRVISALRVANYLAHGILLGPSISVRVQPLTLQQCRHAFGTHTPPGFKPQMLKEQFRASTSTLACLSNNDQRKFSAPLFEKAEKTVLYIRGDGYTTLDPLLFALEQLVHVEILPGLAEAKGRSGPETPVILVPSPQKDLSLVLEDISRFQEHSDDPGSFLLLTAGDLLPDNLPPGLEVDQLPISLYRLADALVRI
jgi:CheY-like chemotaxis protein/HD-like signal output (HDOD) protein